MGAAVRVPYNRLLLYTCGSIRKLNEPETIHIYTPTSYLVVRFRKGESETLEKGLLPSLRCGGGLKARDTVVRDC